jgi:hypothetical protein
MNTARLTSQWKESAGAVVGAGVEIAADGGDDTGVPETKFPL